MAVFVNFTLWIMQHEKRSFLFLLNRNFKVNTTSVRILTGWRQTSGLLFTSAAKDLNSGLL